MDELILCWEIVPRILNALNIFISAYIFTGFIKPYLKKPVHADIGGLVYCAGMITAYLIPPVLTSPTAYLLGCGGAFIAISAAERENICQKIFLSVTAYLMPWVIHSAYVIPWQLLYEFLMYSDTAFENPWLQFGIFMVLEILSVAMRTGLMYLLSRVVNRFYIYKRERLSARELAVMLLPVLPAVVGYWLIIYYEEIYLSDHSDYIWSLRPEYQWLQLLFQAVSVGAVLAAVYFSQRLKQSRREEKENAVLNEQIEDIKRHIGRLEEIYGEVRLLRHDVKNHITALEGLYRSGMTEQAGEYAARLAQSMDSFASGIKSGDPVADIILEEKRSAAEEKGISFRSGFFFPSENAPDVFDVCVILGNALDNAIENADGDAPFISVSSTLRKNAYLITVKNSFSGVFSDEDGLPETTKRDKREHGCGLANIRRVAEKYYGEISFSAKDGAAELTVMMMLG